MEKGHVKKRKCLEGERKKMDVGTMWCLKGERWKISMGNVYKEKET